MALSRPFWLLPLGRLHAAWWILPVAALVLVDDLTGPRVEVPAIYSIPVALAAWYSGRTAGLVLALTLPISRLVLVQWVWPPGTASLEAETVAALLRLCTFTLLALLMYRLCEHERALQRNLTLLQGLLPLCSHCKRIKNASNEWEPLESYLESRSGAEFTHSICPQCARERYHDANA
ncbi:MAG TPA: hypothetical protein VN654_02610 [Vicinamibacterales bacterium]|nr:hypothetical protein [Vicinamibacterales bacterium]